MHSADCCQVGESQQVLSAAPANKLDKPWTASCVMAQTVLEQGGQFAGINRKVQLKTLRWSPQGEAEGPDAKPHPVEALLILKHGGVLTHAGRAQV